MPLPRMTRSTAQSTVIPIRLSEPLVGPLACGCVDRVASGRLGVRVGTGPVPTPVAPAPGAGDRVGVEVGDAPGEPWATLEAPLGGSDDVAHRSSPHGAGGG